MPDPLLLDTIEKISRTLSIAAIPVVLGVGGWLIQRQLQDQTIRRDYVQLGVKILQNPDASQVPPELREWAVDLLDANSPTKMNAQALHNLKSGSLTLPSFTFTPSPALTPDLKRTLEAALEDFKKYLAKLGFVVPGETISVAIAPGNLVEIEGQSGVAFWDQQTRTISIGAAFANDKTTALRQFAHAFLTQKGVATDQDHYDYFALESGVASYFPCSFANHPLVGDQASEAGRALSPPENLLKHRGFAEIKLDRWDSVQNDGSEVWGGFFWELREMLGREPADQLIADTWRGFTPPKGLDAYAAFAKTLLAKAEPLDRGQRVAPIRRALESRGLRL